MLQLALQFVLAEAMLLRCSSCEPQEAELEGLLFGRDEEALDQLGREGEGDGGSVSEFLRSYAAGAAVADGEDVEGALDTQQQAPGSGRLMFEDRQGARDDDAGPDSMHGVRQRRRPVWEDSQDEHVRVNVAARSQLRKLRQAEAEVELTGGYALFEEEQASCWHMPCSSEGCPWAGVQSDPLWSRWSHPRA